MAQPGVNVFGHLISITVGILFNEIFGTSFITLGLAAGFALALRRIYILQQPQIL